MTELVLRMPLAGDVLAPVLVYGDHFVVLGHDLASGRPLGWFAELVDAARAEVELDGIAMRVSVRIVDGPERDKLSRHWTDHPVHGGPFAAREQAAPGSVPIAVLDRYDTYDRKRAMNRQIIEEFRANRGQVSYVTEDGLSLAGVPLLLLHHVGRRSGVARVNPLQYGRLGRSFVVVATNGGSPRHPDWYLNLIGRPETVIEVGTETHRVVARVARAAERAGLIGRGDGPRGSRRYGGYDQFVAREVPVVVLDPAADSPLSPGRTES